MIERLAAMNNRRRIVKLLAVDAISQVSSTDSEQHHNITLFSGDRSAETRSADLKLADKVAARIKRKTGRRAAGMHWMDRDEESAELQDITGVAVAPTSFKPPHQPLLSP